MMDAEGARVSPLPWQNAPWKHLTSRLDAGRLPHALLITGLPGVGKSAFADLLAKRCLCESPTADGYPCGTCRGCHLADSGSHPDLVCLKPEEGRRGMRVDQVRALTAFVSLSSQYAGMRVAIMDPSDSLNTNAANALLKTLEEPPEDSVLLLTASRPGNLPPTIRSRCQTIVIRPPARADALAWLAAAAPQRNNLAANLTLASGAPLLALRYAESDLDSVYEALASVLLDLSQGRTHPVAAAEALSSPEPVLILELLTRLLGDLVRYRYDGPETVHNPALPRLQQAANGLDLMMLHSFFQYLLDTKRCLSQPLNEQLLIEDLLVRWSRIADRATGRRESRKP